MADVVYWGTLLLLLWAYSGYILILLIRHALADRNKSGIPQIQKYPDILVLIPFYNEEEYVERKVANCKQLSYEGNVIFYFIDGMSNDRSAEIVKRNINDRNNFHFLQSGCRGKVLQMNHVLLGLINKAGIVVSTDADALLEVTTLKKIAEAFLADSGLGVVGVAVEPQSCLSIELQYWRDQNLIRFLESGTGYSSMVCAPCYAFRSELFHSFPCSCVADDIFITHFVNCSGFRSSYLDTVKCLEIRTPGTWKQFFTHKFRKGNAYLKELYRFSPDIPSMNAWWRVIFCTRLMQMALIPWLLPLNVVSMLLLIQSGEYWSIVCSEMIFLAGLIAASTGLKLYGAKMHGNDIKGISIVPFVAVNLVMMAVAISFPFTRQTSCYKKVEKCVKQKQMYTTG